MKQLEFYLQREKIIGLIREFFANKKFHEIITPVLNDKIPLEPNIFPFETEWRTTKGNRKLFLSTSPEKNLKKMLSVGIKNCFSIGHSFRNLEASGPLHTPEFLMLEWYRKNADYKNIMNDIEKLIIFVYKQITNNHFNISCLPAGMVKHYNRISLVDLFKKYCRLDLKEVVLHDQELFDYAKEKEYQTKKTTWNQLYDQIFVNEIEPHLPKEPCFLIDFPSRISPLCKPKKNEPYLAERFELYINRIELANGNTENTNVSSVKKGLLKPIDQEFLQSLTKMEDFSYAGVGLGVDRFVKLFAKHKEISVNL